MNGTLTDKNEQTYPNDKIEETSAVFGKSCHLVPPLKKPCSFWRPVPILHPVRATHLVTQLSSPVLTRPGRVAETGDDVSR